MLIDHHTNANKLQNILIVSDDNDVRREIAQLVENMNIEIRQAPSAARAFCLLQHGISDLIITDNSMPGKIDGAIFVSVVKNHPDYKNIPVILFNVNSNQKSKNEAFSTGAESVITKPIKEDQFQHSIKLLLNNPLFCRDTNSLLH